MKVDTHSKWQQRLVSASTPHLQLKPSGGARSCQRRGATDEIWPGKSPAGSSWDRAAWVRWPLVSLCRHWSQAARQVRSCMCVDLQASNLTQIDGNTTSHISTTPPDRSNCRLFFPEAAESTWILFKPFDFDHDSPVEETNGCSMVSHGCFLFIRYFHLHKSNRIRTWEKFLFDTGKNVPFLLDIQT